MYSQEADSSQARESVRPALKGMIPASDSPLAAWLEAVRARHPEVQAAQARARAARRRADAVASGFRDPVLQTSAGYSEGPGDVPHVSLGRILPADAFSVQGGFEAPVGAGLYGGLGASVQNVDPDDAADGSGSYSRTLAGGRLRLPLLRDRGYRTVRIEEALREAEAREAEAAVQAAIQVLERDVVLAYAGWLQDTADSREVGRAMERAEKLLEETSARVELQVVPEYQVYPARFEAALRREELESSRQQILLRNRTLGERLGTFAAPPVPEGDVPEGLLLRWADALTQQSVPALTMHDALRRRGEYLRARERAAAAEAEVLASAELLKDDLSLQAGLGWDRNDADDGRDSGNEAGFEAAILYRRTLGRRGERERIAAARAELEARLAELTLLEVQFSAQIDRALASWESSCLRLELARSAVVEARQVLAAEDERFSLGEGSSRNVLDAQKDLTSASRRNVAVAGQVITAMAELRYALGQPQDGD